MAEAKTAGERMADAAEAQARETKRCADALEALVATAGAAVKALEARPASAVSAQRSAGGGAVFGNYGKNKGGAVAGASESDLRYYGGGCVRTLEDESKQRFHAGEERLLAAIVAEMRKRNLDVSDFVADDRFGPPPSGRGGYAPNGGGPERGGAMGGPSEDEIPFIY